MMITISALPLLDQVEETANLLGDDIADLHPLYLPSMVIAKVTDASTVTVEVPSEYPHWTNEVERAIIEAVSAEKSPMGDPLGCKIERIAISS